MIEMMNRIIQLKSLILGSIITLSILGSVQAQVTQIDLYGSRDSAAYERDTVTVPIIVSASGLANENIIAFNLQFAHSASIKPIKFSTTGTGIDGWDLNSNILSTTSFSISGASVNAIASDSVVLVWVDFELQEVTGNTAASYYLTGENNYFNESDYTFDQSGSKQGYITIYNRPDLAVSVNPAVLLRGDSASISTSNAVGPVTLNSSDDNIASVSESNYLIAHAPGFIKVTATDSVGGSGESNQVEVKGFRLYPIFMEDDVYNGDTATMYIMTTDLTDLGVISGTFQFNVSNATILDVSKSGTLLENASLEVDSIDNVTRKVGFAGTGVLSGADTLLRVRLIVNETGSSFSANFDNSILFNEDLSGLYTSGFKYTTSLPAVGISVATSIPNPIIPGNTIDFDATNATGPIVWSLSDNSVGTIDEDGIFTAVRSGQTSILVVDSIGGKGSYGPLTVKDGILEIASEVAVFANEHPLPIRISALPEDRALFAFDFTVNIDTSKISFVEVVKTGTLSENFSVVTNNADPRKIKVVGAGQESIKTAGDLVHFKIQLKESFVSGTTNLTFSDVVLNEGLPVLNLINGVVTPGDPPPVAKDTTLSILEDQLFAFKTEDFPYSQPQGKDFARVLIQNLPSKGSLKFNNSPAYIGQIIDVGSISGLTYIAAADSSAVAYSSFQVKVGDSDYFSNNVCTITIDVDPVNDPPRFELESDSVILDEDFANTISVTLTESLAPQEPNETYSYSLSPASVPFANLSIDTSTGEITFTSIADSSGVQKIYVLADDGQPEFNVAMDSFILVINNVNDQPSAYDSTFSVSENAPVGYIIGYIGGSDIDGDELTYAFSSTVNVTELDIDSLTGALSISELLDFETTPAYSLEVIVSDGIESDTSQIDIIVLDANDEPTLNDQTFSIDEESVAGTIVGNILASDINNDTLSFVITSGNELQAFALNAESGVLTVNDQSVLDFETTPSFALTIEVSDGSLTATATITINLNDIDESVNQAPQISDQSFSIDEESVAGTIVGNILASDINNDTLSFVITSGNDLQAFVLNAESGVLTVNDQSVLDFETTPSFALTAEVSDGSLTATATITINLNDIDESVNQAPQISDQTFIIDEQSVTGTIVGNILASDINNDNLTFVITSGNELQAFALNAESGVLTVNDQSLLDFETTPSFALTVEVSDGSLTATATITINLNDIDESVNQAPQISDQTFIIDEQSVAGTIVGNILASDINNDNLTFIITSGNELQAFVLNAESGELTVNDQSLLDFETTPSFALTVEVSDGSLTATATITINLNDIDESINQAPVMSNQSFNIDENSTVGTTVGTVIASDPNQDALNYTITSGNELGAFELDATSGVITVANGDHLDFETIPTFTLTAEVSDGNLSTSATITINLNDLDEAVNQSPVITSQSFNIDENSAVGTVVGTIAAFDPDDDPVTFSILTGNETGGFSIDASSGTLAVANSNVLDFETKSEYVLNIEVSDGELAASASITITLNDVNEVVLITTTINRVMIYPNPSSDRIYFNSSHQPIKQVMLFDSDGKLLVQKTQIGFLDISEYPNGVYLVYCFDNSKWTHHRLIIQD